MIKFFAKRRNQKIVSKSESQNGFLLKVEDLKTHFFSREGTVKAIDRVSFAIKKGEALGIVGESGCGKSVTAQSILQIVPKPGKIMGGKILFDLGGEFIDIVTLHPEAKEMRNIRGKGIAMIFQEPMTSFSPVHTIGNQIMEAITIHEKTSRQKAKERVIELLAKVGIPKPEEIIDAYPFNLSGGMRQRAMIAMALSSKPRLLIADEPTTAVDVTIQAQVLEVVKKLRDDLGMSLIMITHDLAVIAELVNKVLIMYLGKGVEYTSVNNLFSNPKHPYTKGLLASIPQLGAGSGQKIDSIPGSVPGAYELPSGCLFHPRCSDFISGLCDKREPALSSVGQDHEVSCFLYGR